MEIVRFIGFYPASEKEKANKENYSGLSIGDSVEVLEKLCSEYDGETGKFYTLFIGRLIEKSCFGIEFDSESGKFKPNIGNSIERVLSMKYFSET